MATITRRGGAWRVKIRRKAYKPVSRSFDYKADAQVWAAEVELAMAKGTWRDPDDQAVSTVREALQRYIKEVCPEKKGAAQCEARCKLLQRTPFAGKPFTQLTTDDIAKWRDDRLKKEHRSPDTIRNDLSVLSHLYRVAGSEWGMKGLENPVKPVQRPRAGAARTRRLQAGEEERLLAACPAELRAFVIVAIDTAMRRGEIHGMRRSFVVGGIVKLPDTKNNESREVPLLPRAQAALDGLPARLDGKIWSWVVPSSITHEFQAACRRAGIEDLRLHDLRHEGTSRFFEMGLSAQEVATITGHKTLIMLQRYTQLRATDIQTKMLRLNAGRGA